MTNHLQSETLKAGKPQRDITVRNEMTELTDNELLAVAGGLNPQPLPPCHEDVRL